MKTLGEIEILTKDFSAARGTLRDRVQNLDDEIAALKRKYLPGIRKAVEAATEKHSLLKAAIEEAPSLFEKPRTYIFHGVKVGYQKQKGTVKIDKKDYDRVVKLIKKHFPDTWGIYVEVKEKPLSSTLQQLSVQDLKKLGITVSDTGDAILIKSTDSEIDKLVNALLKDEEEVEDAA